MRSFGRRSWHSGLEWAFFCPYFNRQCPDALKRHTPTAITADLSGNCKYCNGQIVGCILAVSLTWDGMCAKNCRPSHQQVWSSVRPYLYRSYHPIEHTISIKKNTASSLTSKRTRHYVLQSTSSWHHTEHTIIFMALPLFIFYLNNQKHRHHLHNILQSTSSRHGTYHHIYGTPLFFIITIKNKFTVNKHPWQSSHQARRHMPQNTPSKDMSWKTPSKPPIVHAIRTLQITRHHKHPNRTRRPHIP